MKALHGGRTFTEQIDYHLADGRAPEFDKGQRGRVNLARSYIKAILTKIPRPLRIVELGCGSGDVSGPYAREGIEVIGVDVTQAAALACMRRWPAMTFLLSPVEKLRPTECDVLVMTEFLEHVADPKAVADAWMPLAKWAVIGHPIDEPDPPIEMGHAWSYSVDDWVAWFEDRSYTVLGRTEFPMGPYPHMILGYGQRQ